MKQFPIPCPSARVQPDAAGVAPSRVPRRERRRLEKLARTVAKRKSKEWRQLLGPALPAQIAISRPGRRPVSTSQYERSFAGFITKPPSAKPVLCFNHSCSNELRTVPDVRLFVQVEENTTPIGMGVCEECARCTDAELRALAGNQFENHFGLHQQAPANSASAAVVLPEGVAFDIAGVPIFVSPEAGIGAAAVFIELLEQGELPEFTAFRKGVGNCHAITTALFHDLMDARCADLFAFKRGSSELLKSEHDPRGLHSWLEIKASRWAIDAANGAIRPVVIMQVDAFYRAMRITDVRDIETRTQNGANK